MDIIIIFQDLWKFFLAQSLTEQITMSVTFLSAMQNLYWLVDVFIYKKQRENKNDELKTNFKILQIRLDSEKNILVELKKRMKI